LARDKLGPEQIEQFKKHGFTVMRRAFEDEAVAQFDGVGHRLVQQPEALGPPLGLSRSEPARPPNAYHPDRTHLAFPCGFRGLELAAQGRWSSSCMGEPPRSVKEMQLSSCPARGLQAASDRRPAGNTMRIFSAFGLVSVEKRREKACLPDRREYEHKGLARAVGAPLPKATWASRLRVLTLQARRRYQFLRHAMCRTLQPI